MERINFAQILNNSTLDIRREYERLYFLFYQEENYGNLTLQNYCEMHFDMVPFRDTCITLEDFNNVYGFEFQSNPPLINMDYLVLFCEYTYNLVLYASSEIAEPYIQQVFKVIDKIGYTQIYSGTLSLFVPQSQAALEASKKVSSTDLSFKICYYNHHSLKGDIQNKKSILISLANELEPSRKELRKINSELESNVFFCYNNLNIRHNNLTGSNCKQYTATMSSKDLESLYDDTYQMSLLAILELDNISRMQKINALKEQY